MLYNGIDITVDLEVLRVYITPVVFGACDKYNLIVRQYPQESIIKSTFQSALEWRSITTDPGSIPGCITNGCDRESHRAKHNWPSIILV